MLFGVRVRRVEQRAETRRRGRGAINSINGRRRDRQTDSGHLLQSTLGANVVIRSHQKKEVVVAAAAE